MMRSFALVACLLSLAVLPPALADGPDHSLTYQQSIDSVFLVCTAAKDGIHSTFGTGVLIDAEHRLVLTAHHVIGEAKTAVIFPPARDAKGEIINEPDYYLTNKKRLGVECAIVDQDAKRDLALLRMPSPPAGRAIPIAGKSARPGQSLLTIGNSLATKKTKVAGVLWRFSGGSVRQVYDDNYEFDDGQEITARVLEMTVPINPGDSGGPVINLSGELVGITSAIVPKENQIHKAIDVTEIWAFLRKPDRELSLTLYDAAQSSINGSSRKLSYQIVSVKGMEANATLTHRFQVTTDAEGKLTVSSVMAVAAGK